MQNANYAGFWKRFLAYNIDSLILSLISLSFGAVIRTGSSQAVAFFPGIFIAAAYFIFFWMRDGQTLGNRLLAIKVVREDGQKFDIGTGVIRYIGYIISSAVLCLGFLWVIWDKKKQGWHDKIAKTVVVKTDGKSHTVIASIIVIGLMVIFVLIIAGFLAAGALVYKEIKNNPQALNNTVSQNANPTLSESEINALADETFNAVNSNRVKKGLPALVLNQNLCAYAQKRLEELDSFGKFDDYKGFLEDIKDPNVVRVYFEGKGQANNLVYEYLTPPVTGSEIANFWENIQHSAVNDVIFTKGCVRGNTKFMTIVVSS